MGGCEGGWRVGRVREGEEGDKEELGEAWKGGWGYAGRISSLVSVLMKFIRFCFYFVLLLLQYENEMQKEHSS